MADINEIISQSALDNIKAADKYLSQLDNSILDSITTIEKMNATLAENSKSYRLLNQQQKLAIIAAQNQQRELKLQEKAEAELRKGRQKQIEMAAKLAAKEKERADALKLTVKSISDAERQNKALRETIKNLDATTKEGAKAIKEYNQQVERNTNFIRQNSDAATKQRMNIGNYKDAIKGFGNMIAGAFSISAILGFGKAAFKASEEQERANRRLLYSLQGNKAAYNALSKSASEMQERLDIPDNVIMDLQVMAAETGRSTSEIKKITEAAAQLSAVTGQDLNSAYMMLNNSLSGNVRGLNRIDVEFSQLTKDQLASGAAIDLVLNKYGGLAEQAVRPTQKLNVAWGEFMETLGSGESGPINYAINKLTELATALKGAYEWAFKFGGSREAMQTANEQDISNINQLASLEKRLSEQKKKYSKEVWQDMVGKEIQKTNEVIAAKRTELDGDTKLSKVQKINLEKNIELLEGKVGIMKASITVQRNLNKEEKEGKTATEQLADKIQKLKAQISDAILKTGQAPDGLMRQLLGSEAELKRVQEQVDDIVNGIQKVASKGYKTVTDPFTGKTTVQNIATGGANTSLLQPRNVTGGAAAAGAAGTNSLFTNDEIRNLSLEGAQTTSDAIFQIVANADQAAFDHKMSLLDKEKEKKLKNANLTEKQKAKIEEDYQKKVAKLKEEQFRKEKAASIIQAIINTALAVTKAAPDVASMIAAGIAGAASIAVIAAQPVPQFDAGTDYTPRTFIAGERRPEWMISPDGNVQLITRPTMFKNMAGATVIGGAETERLMKAGLTPTNDIRPDIRQMKDELKAAIIGKRELHISASGSTITEREGDYYKTYFNKSIRWAGRKN